LNGAGVVAALAAEARALGPTRRRDDGCALLGDGTLLAVSGIGAAAAEGAARRLIAGGATSLVSWGMAGGLDPRLEAGAVCLPLEVLSADGMRFASARSWRECLSAQLSLPAARLALPLETGKLLTVTQPIDTIEAKQALFRETGAAAVDMESGAIAAVAQAHGLPFIAVRVIVDTARDPLPRAVSRASGGGELHIGRLLVGLARSPGELIDLVRLGRRYRLAIRALRAVARAA